MNGAAGLLLTELFLLSVPDVEFFNHAAESEQQGASMQTHTSKVLGLSKYLVPISLAVRHSEDISGSMTRRRLVDRTILGSR
jgi:hypothetical protein